MLWWSEIIVELRYFAISRPLPPGFGHPGFDSLCAFLGWADLEGGLVMLRIERCLG